jgi:hypothetical protein
MLERIFCLFQCSRNIRWPLVEIGLTVRPKTGGAKALPAPPLATGLKDGVVLRKENFLGLKLCTIFQGY